VDAASLILVERLAERLCHDFASASQAVASGLDLLTEASGPAERDEAQAFLAEAVASQKARLQFARKAYGPAADSTAASEAEALVRDIFNDIRPTLDWQVGPAGLAPAEVHALLILGQLGADILAAGGVARLALTGTEVELDAEGPRPMLRDDLRDGLTGVAGEAGLGGRWAQGAFLRALATSVGGNIWLEERSGGVRIRVSLRPGG
jgi:hypothetical protein